MLDGSVLKSCHCLSLTYMHSVQCTDGLGHKAGQIMSGSEVCHVNINYSQDHMTCNQRLSPRQQLLDARRGAVGQLGHRSGTLFPPSPAVVCTSQLRHSNINICSRETNPVCLGHVHFDQHFRVAHLVIKIWNYNKITYSIIMKANKGYYFTNLITLL